MAFLKDPNAEGDADDHGVGTEALATKVTDSQGRSGYVQHTIVTDSSGNPIDSDTSYNTSNTTPTTVTHAVPQTPAPILAANTSRVDYMLYNNGTAGMLLVGHGFYPNANKFTYKVAAQDSTQQLKGYRGAVYAWQDTADGIVMVTEGTP